MQRIFNLVFIISIIISIVFSWYIARLLTKPVKQFIEVCKKIGQGDMSSRLNIHSGDEMEWMARTFNLIMDQINQNFQREMIQQKRENDLKIDVLRAQINPHFLYNTLDSIKSLAILQGIHNVASMCAALINLLKYNLSSSMVAELRDEVESLENYVSLQKYRYGDIFEFRTGIDKSTENCTVARFVLQPLVENSIIHGIADMESGGEISVRSCLKDGYLYLWVTDNGGGMDAETVNSLNQSFAKFKRFQSIGVANIQERIQLQFGGEAALSYQSGIGAGTTVELRFPVNYTGRGMDPGLPIKRQGDALES
jgi:two-component system sensor histidine kinase YesM